MYTQDKLNHFAEWLEGKGEIDIEAKKEIISSVLHGMKKQKGLHKHLDANEVKIDNIIELVRCRINAIEFYEEIGICSNGDEENVFEGIEILKKQFESEVK